MSDTKIVLATTNTHKAHEMRAILAPLLPKSIAIISLAELAQRVASVEETGETFDENAMLKAKHYARETGHLCVADDSGLCVDALAGAPGLYSSRWAGPDATDQDRIQKLLDSLQRDGTLYLSDRKASFVCAAAAASPNGWSTMARGFCPGVIATEPQGEGGFGYDPVFYMPEFGQTMAEISQADKNRVSHRSRALSALAPDLAAYLKRNGPKRADFSKNTGIF